MPNIAIATCAKFPALTESDEILAGALRRAGATVNPAPWNVGFTPFAEADLTVVRSTWDYFDLAEEFTQWIARLESEARVVNSPDTLRWNMTKAYLFELAEKGAPTPPTIRIQPGSASIKAAMDELDLTEAVVKPLVGGTASGLSHLRQPTRDDLERAVAILNGDALVQPFLPEIKTLGETSLMFLGGEFSHAVRKTPKSGDIRVQEEHGGASELVEAPDWAIAEAQRILSLCPGETAYARIDVVLFDDHLTLMEAELVEPELFFPYCPKAADYFAAVLLEQIA